ERTAPRCRSGGAQKQAGRHEEPADCPGGAVHEGLSLDGGRGRRLHTGALPVCRCGAATCGPEGGRRVVEATLAPPALQGNSPRTAFSPLPLFRGPPLRYNSRSALPHASVASAGRRRGPLFLPRRARAIPTRERAGSVQARGCFFF